MPCDCDYTFAADATAVVALPAAIVLQRMYFIVHKV